MLFDNWTFPNVDNTAINIFKIHYSYCDALPLLRCITRTRNRIEQIYDNSWKKPLLMILVIISLLITMFKCTYFLYLMGDIDWMCLLNFQTSRRYLILYSKHILVIMHSQYTNDIKQVLHVGTIRSRM